MKSPTTSTPVSLAIMQKIEKVKSMPKPSGNSELTGDNHGRSSHDMLSYTVFNVGKF